MRISPLFLLGGFLYLGNMEKIIHQIWVGDKEIPEREKQYVKSLKELNSNYQQFLWFDDNLPDLPLGIKEKYDYFKQHTQWIVCADLLRQYVVYEFGGIYIDLDYEPIQNLDTLEFEKYDGFMLHGDEEDLNICNSLFGFVKKHPLTQHLIDTIINEQPQWYSPRWFGKSVKSFYGLNYENRISELNNKIDKNIRLIHVNELRKSMNHKLLYSWSPENKPKYNVRNSKNPFQ